MKKSMIALTAAIALTATPMMAEDSVVVTKSTTGPEQGITIGIIAAAAVIAGIIIAADDSSSGT